MSSSLSFFSSASTSALLGSGSGHFKLGTGPIPLSSMYIDHTVTRHSTCTYTMMYKGQKQLSCNLFCNYFVSLSPHILLITLILATGTFLSAGRKSSQTTALYSSVQTTALYSSVCEYYVQIALPRDCVEFAAFQCRLATRLAPKWEQPYSRATVVGSLEITVCDHPCR